MSQYQNIIWAHGYKAIEMVPSRPADSLAIGPAEFLKPVTLAASQLAAPIQPAARARVAVNYDQYENIKLYPEITPDSFPYQGGGIK